MYLEAAAGTSRHILSELIPFSDPAFSSLFFPLPLDENFILYNASDFCEELIIGL